MAQCLPCGGIPNVKTECGEFAEPTIRDMGRCSPLPVKIDCEAPVLPTPTCPDPNFSIAYVPENNPPFVITASLLDESCGVILDYNNQAILTHIN